MMKNKLQHAVTQYDIKQSTKKGYNIHALGIYFARIDEICADVEAGADVRAAILAGFTGRVADACLKAIGQTISTKEENFGGPICYTPVAKDQIAKGNAELKLEAKIAGL